MYIVQLWVIGWNNGAISLDRKLFLCASILIDFFVIQALMGCACWSTDA